MKVIKKDFSLEDFEYEKIATAVSKAAARCDIQIDEASMKKITQGVFNRVSSFERVSVAKLHEVVIGVLTAMGYESVSKSYAEYRYYKTNYAKTFEKLHQDADVVLRLGDRENANFDSSLVSTKGSLIKGYLTKSLYKQFYLSKREKELIERGDIYIHDLRDMILGCVNCLRGSTWVTIRQGDEISTVTLDDLRERLNVKEGVFCLSRGIQILSRNGWVALEGISVRKLENDEPVYKIQARNGLYIEATENHRIPVMTQDGNEVVKYVKDIEVGDSLISVSDVSLEQTNNIIDLCDYADEEKTYVNNMRFVKRYFEYKHGQSLQAFCRANNISIHKNLRNIQLSEFKKLKSLIQIPYEAYAKLTLCRKGASVRVPLLLPVTNELARMFGYIFADGCVAKTSGSNYQVNFSSTKLMLLADFVCSAETAFPDVNVVRRDPLSTSTTPCSAVTLCNAVVWDLFKTFKQGAANIEIPDFILNGSEEVKRNFIVAAMDCDGSYGETEFKYTTVSKKYAEQFVLLLQSLGYTPVLSVRNSKGSVYCAGDIVGTRNYDTYLVKLCKYEEQKRFAEETDNLRKNEVNIKERNSVPCNPTKITKIVKEYHENEYVYDLQTEDSWFVANGYVVHNCCLFDIGNVMKGGFSMSNVEYTEPKTVLSALQVTGDITLVATAQQFGGFTLSELDKVLLPYCKKTLHKAKMRYLRVIGTDEERINDYAWEDLRRELEQGFQSLELKLNTVPCSRGDFAFTTITFGQWDVNLPEEDKKILYLINSVMLEVRRNGHGSKNKPVVFPKLVYLFDKTQVDGDMYSSDLFDEAVKTSAKCMYPDYLSINSDHGTVSRLFREQGAITSPMGKRLF